MGEANLLSRLPNRASRPSADALFGLGLRLANRTEGSAFDLVTAHALFEVAARLGSLEAKVYRRKQAVEMDPADVADAQFLARAWLAEPAL